MEKCCCVIKEVMMNIATSTKIVKFMDFGQGWGSMAI
jgi:hypothetical protein